MLNQMRLHEIEASTRTQILDVLESPIITLAQLGHAGTVLSEQDACASAQCPGLMLYTVQRVCQVEGQSA